MAEYKGLTIRFEGDDSDLSAVLHRIGDRARDAQRHLTGINSAMKLDPNNTKLAEAQLKHFGEEARASKDRLASLRAGLEAVPATIEKNEQRIAELRNEVQQNVEAYQQLELRAKLAASTHEGLSERLATVKSRMEALYDASEKDSEEYKKLEAEAKRLEKSMEFAENEMRETAQAQKELEDRTAAAISEMTRLGEKNKELANSTEKFNEDIAIEEARFKGLSERLKALAEHLAITKGKMFTFSTSLQQLGGWAQSAGDKLVSVGMALSTIAGLSAMTIGRKIIDETEEFGNAISQVGVYLGVEGEQLKEMSDLALYWGKETRYSATEAAEAMSELAKGGLTAMEIRGGAMEATMSLAAAGQMELADAALTVAQSMRAFGLEASSATEVADALAGVANNTTSTVEGLANGFRYVAGWSRLSSWDIHEVSGALGLLADYGLQGEMAGTALRNVLMRLAAPTDKARGIMEEYGIEVRDAEGHMKSAVEVIDQLNTAFEGVSEEERDAALNAMFGARGINAASALMDAGSDELQKYIDMTNEADAAFNMAQGQLGDLGWALEYLRGEAETAAVNIGNALTPMLVDLAGKAEDLLERFNALSADEQLDLAKKFAGMLLAGPAMVALGTGLKGLGGAFNGIGKGLQYILEFSGQLKAGGDLAEIIGRTAASVGGFAADEIKLAEATASATTSLTSLKVAAGLGLVALVAFGAYAVWKHFDDARKRTEKLEASMSALTGAAGDSGRATEELAENLDDVRRSARDTRDEIDELVDSHFELAKQIRDDNRELAHNEDRLKDARDTVVEYLDEMTSGTELDAEAQGRLTTALQTLESQYGITISRGDDGIYYLETEEGQADLTKDAIYRLCDAKLYEAQIDAYTSRYSSLYEQKLGYEEDRAKVLRDIAETEREINRLETMTPDQIREAYGSVTDPSGLDTYNAVLANRNAELDSYNESLDELNGLIDDTNKSLSDTEYELGAVQTASEGAETSLGQWASMDDRIRQFASGSLTDFGNALDNIGVDADKMKSVLQGLSDEELETLMSQFDGSSDSIRNSLGAMTGDVDLFSDNWQRNIELIARETGRSTEEIVAAIAEGVENGTIEVGDAGAALYQALTPQFKAEDARKNGAVIAKETYKGMLSESKRSAILNNAASAAHSTFMRAFTSPLTSGGGPNIWEGLFGDSTELRGVIENPENIKAAAQAGENVGDSYVGGMRAGMKRVDLRSTVRRQVTVPVSDGMQSASKYSSNWGRALTANFSAGMGRVSIAAKASSVMGGTSAQMQKYNDQSFTWGYHLVSNFAAGMELARGKVNAALGGMTADIAGTIGHSTPKYGPLKHDDVWGLHLGQNFASGMMDSLPEIERASLAMADAVQQPILDYGFDDGAFLTDVADNVRANQQVNIYFNDVNVNDSPAIRGAFVNLMYEVNRAGVMQGGRR